MDPDYVLNEKTPLLEDSDGQETRKKLACALKRICDTKDAQGNLLGGPSKFYALLLADGDRLGRLVSQVGGAKVSRSLAKFTGAVPEVVKKHDGVTVYAGGDDVLAMLPTPEALDCAKALSDRYQKSFDDAEAADGATLSAAVVFAHTRHPLSSVLKEAHRLLDEVAKDGNGRNSLAVSTIKPSGPYCQWVSAWTRPGPGGDNCAVTLLNRLKSDFSGSRAEPRLSSALLYRIRDSLSLLCDWDRWKPGQWGNTPRSIDLHPFIRAEVFHSLDVRMAEDAGSLAESLTSSILSLLSPARNPRGVDGPAKEAGVDALLLARFLADPDDGEASR